jgi:hypothetical protein
MVVEKGFGLIQGYIMSNQRFYNYFWFIHCKKKNIMVLCLGFNVYGFECPWFRV